MEQVAGAQPGVKQIRVDFPKGDTILIYDSSQITVQDLIRVVVGQRPDLTITVASDGPLP